MEPLSQRNVNSRLNQPSPLKTRSFLARNPATPLRPQKKAETPWAPPGKGRFPGPSRKVETGREKMKGGVGAGDRERVLVCVRVKPSLDPSSIYDCTANTISLGAEHPSNKRRGGKGREEEGEFAVDHLHLPPASTSELFERVVAPVVSAAMDGFDGTVFAYGMTGSGKTYTMGGVPDDSGVIPRSIDQVFDIIDSNPKRETTLRVSYLELYKEKFRDLLHPGAVVVPSVHEQNGRIVVHHLETRTVRNPEDVQKLLQIGNLNRKSGKTDWNEHSSRSHTIFTITIESRPVKSESSSDEAVPTQLSRLNLIDLAGSERAVSDAERQKEGAYINNSLLVLSNVIEKLTSPHLMAHVPYRDSKLTWLIRDSLSGHARIAVICTVSLEEKHASEAVSTLRFASRVSRVVTKAERGTVASDKSVIQLYENEIASLRAQLAAIQVPSIRDLPDLNDNSDSEEEDSELLESEKERLRQVQSERAKSEQEVYQLELRRTKLQSQITAISEFTLRSETTASSSCQDLPRPRRRRISEFPKSNLGLRTTPGTPLLEGHGDGQRGDEMTALLEEAFRKKGQARESELVNLRTRLTELKMSETNLIAERAALISDHEARVQSLQLENAQNRQEMVVVVSKLQQDLGSVSSDRTSSLEEAARLQTQVNDLLMQHEQNVVNAKSQSSSLATLQDAIVVLQARTKEQDGHVGTLRTQLLTTNAAHATATELSRNSHSELERQVESLRVQLTESEARRMEEDATRKEELERSKAEHDQLVTTLESSEAQLIGAVSDLEEKLLRQNLDHVAEIQDLRSRGEEVVVELRSQVEKVDQQRTVDSQEAAERNQQLVLQLSVAREEKAACLISLDDAVAKQLQAEQITEAVGMELRLFRTEAEDQEAELEDQLERLGVELDGCKTDRMKLKEEISILRSSTSSFSDKAMNEKTLKNALELVYHEEVRAKSHFKQEAQEWEGLFRNVRKINRTCKLKLREWRYDYWTLRRQMEEREERDASGSVPAGRNGPSESEMTAEAAWIQSERSRIHKPSIIHLGSFSFEDETRRSLGCACGICDRTSSTQHHTSLGIAPSNREADAPEPSGSSHLVPPSF